MLRLQNLSSPPLDFSGRTSECIPRVSSLRSPLIAATARPIQRMLRLQNLSSPPLDLSGRTADCIPRVSSTRSPLIPAVQPMCLSRNYYCGNWRSLSTTQARPISSSGLTTANRPGASASPVSFPNSSQAKKEQDEKKCQRLFKIGVLLSVASRVTHGIEIAAGAAAEKPLSILFGNQPLFVIPSIASLLLDLKAILIHLSNMCLLTYVTYLAILFLRRVVVPPKGAEL